VAAADGGSDEESDEDNEGDRMTPETLLAALRQSTTARRLFVCPPDEDGYHKPECLENTCSACGSFQLFHEKLAQISSLLPEGALHGEVEEHGDAECNRRKTKETKILMVGMVVMVVMGRARRVRVLRMIRT